MTQPLSARTLRALSRIDPARSGSAIIFDWCAIVASVWYCTNHWHPLLYLVTVMWVGARQQGLAVLMHEGAHHLLFRHRRWNDLVAEVLLGWPIGVSMQSYRSMHFRHHRYTNTDQDPDWVRNRPDALRAVRSWGEALQILAGFRGEQRQLLKMVMSFRRDHTTGGGPGWVVARLSCYGLVLGAITSFRFWAAFVLYWVVPLTTWFLVIMRLRGIAEHFAVEKEAVGVSRTTHLSLWERLFVAPHNVNYHIEHHLYPSVPFYRLPELHALLMNEHIYRAKAHVTHTYGGVLRECLLKVQVLDLQGLKQL